MSVLTDRAALAQLWDDGAQLHKVSAERALIIAVKRVQMLADLVGDLRREVEYLETRPYACKKCGVTNSDECQCGMGW